VTKTYMYKATSKLEGIESMVHETIKKYSFRLPIKKLTKWMTKKFYGPHMQKLN